MLFEGQMYSFTERRLPCLPTRNNPELATARYDATDIGVRFVRTGPVTGLESMQLSIEGLCHAGGWDQDGPGETPVVIEAVFDPLSLKGNPRPGRSEWTGSADIQISVAGQRRHLTGIAKAHEQTQTAARFDEPFTSAMT